MSADVVIFCGGRGTRLSERTKEMPKPLIELGEYPVLWHIMKNYAHYNYRSFILTLGYKGEMIVDYFLNKHAANQNFRITLNDIKYPDCNEDWDINFIQTGLDSKTSRRLLLTKDYISTSPFMVTYGDGVADMDIPALLKHHQFLKKEYGAIATITITKPYSKYGIVKLDGEMINSFMEKPLMDEYINVGYMVLEPEIFEYIKADNDVMFEDTLEDIAKDGKLGYFIHEGFWHAMDTYKDYVDLNSMWRDNPKWKIWND
jgi:glucose-1-phosphate cytidylyltransferase